MGAEVKTWQHLALAVLAVLVPIATLLQGATFSYVVAIERRLTRLETLQELAAPRRAPLSTEIASCMPPGAGVPPAAADGSSSSARLIPYSRASFSLTSSGRAGGWNHAGRAEALPPCAMPRFSPGAFADRAHRHLELYRALDPPND